MKKISIALSAALTLGFAACCNNAPTTCPHCGESLTDDVAVEAPVAEELQYDIKERPQIDLAAFPKDDEGWITIFDGKTFNGWRGYLREDVPSRWTIEDGCIRFNGAGEGEAQSNDGGDIIFAHKFKNFELEVEWKIEKGGNSGIFYLAQEVEGQPIYISAPECQVLDDANHPDAQLGAIKGIRQSSSLYDMIPAVPQNANPYEQWNKVRILSYQGTIAHFQNDTQVVEYHLWTPQWKELLDKSKFSQDKWPLAYDLLINCGGENHEGYIGFQDHGNNVWFRNIKVKILE